MPTTTGHWYHTACLAASLATAWPSARLLALHGNAHIWPSLALGLGSLSVWSAFTAILNHCLAGSSVALGPPRALALGRQCQSAQWPGHLTPFGPSQGNAWQAQNAWHTVWPTSGIRIWDALPPWYHCLAL